MITASNISMRFGEDTLFQDVNAKFRPGNRYGLIGANGSGKSTLMQILSGELEPTTGKIAVDHSCTIGHLRQDHFEFDDVVINDIVYMGNPALWAVHQEREELYSKTDLTLAEETASETIEERFDNAGGYTMEEAAAKLLNGLGIQKAKHTQPLNALTGGFKLRVLLAQVLFGQPDILLLDEPTNHLDMESRQWLSNLLQRYAGTMIVISHDRHFINEVCSHIADIDYKSLRMFTGNYDAFMTANQIALERIQRDNQKKEKRITDLKDFINRFSANASKARQATSRKNELAQIELERIEPSSRVSPYIRFETDMRLGDKVIDAAGIGKSYETTLFANLDMTIGNGDKIAIIGRNGIGKTTLLSTLIGELEPDTGQVEFGQTTKISSFPQDAGGLLNTDMQAIDWLKQYIPPNMIFSETDLRAFLGKILFSGDDVFKQVKVLSGGEKARLVIARMMMEAPNVLALDEPTNHLDLESIEALNYALTLVDYTVVFVSHDREFISSLATRIIHISEDGITDYPGSLEEFEAARRKMRK